MTGSTAPCLWKVPLNPGILDILATGAKGVLQLPDADLLHKRSSINVTISMVNKEGSVTKNI